VDRGISLTDSCRHGRSFDSCAAVGKPADIKTRERRAVKGVSRNGEHTMRDRCRGPMVF
jgi:hypothetical protein